MYFYLCILRFGDVVLLLTNVASINQIPQNWAALNVAKSLAIDYRKKSKWINCPN